MKSEISVIIPTYNRLEILKKCLKTIKDNSFTKSYEVIIVNDGSSDGTFIEISNFIKENKFENFYIFDQKNGGPAKARNLGIKKSQSDILLFVGDDSIFDKNLLEEHYVWNIERYPQENVAVLGHNEWSKEIEITPFMNWIDNVGLQFSYGEFVDENSPSWRNLWTCNISFKKNFLMKYGMFDEEFPYAAWEDVELGWRLFKHGLKIKYNKNAIAYHYHPTSFESVKRRMVYHGYSQMILAKKIGKEYSNKFFKQPIKTIINIFDAVITYSGILFLLDKSATFFEKRKIISAIFYPVLYHYKLKGNKNYEKTQNRHR